MLWLLWVLWSGTLHHSWPQGRAAAASPQFMKAEMKGPGTAERDVMSSVLYPTAPWESTELEQETVTSTSSFDSTGLDLTETIRTGQKRACIHKVSQRRSIDLGSV